MPSLRDCPAAVILTDPAHAEGFVRPPLHERRDAIHRAVVDDLITAIAERSRMPLPSASRRRRAMAVPSGSTHVEPPSTSACIRTRSASWPRSARFPPSRTGRDASCSSSGRTLTSGVGPADGRPTSFVGDSGVVGQSWLTTLAPRVESGSSATSTAEAPACSKSGSGTPLASRGGGPSPAGSRRRERFAMSSSLAATGVSEWPTVQAFGSPTLPRSGSKDP